MLITSSFLQHYPPFPRVAFFYLCPFGMIKIATLPNNLRLVFTPLHNTEVAHCALMIKAGTRHEKAGKEGLAHFIEHMLFKGTKKRKSFHILNRLEIVGGELNAFTSKEETCLHASLPALFLERALELISDITFNSLFPVRELEKEKEVVCDEIRTYQDTPGEQIFDDFEAIIFKNNPLGNPILGTEQTVHSFHQKDLLNFIEGKYIPSNMVLSVAAPADEKTIVQLAEKYFGSKKSKPPTNKIIPFRNYKPECVKTTRHHSQCHYMMGKPAPSLHDSNRLTMALVNNILGGPGMNSKLNLGIREKYGYTYTIESGYNSYSDTGIFHVYLATDKKYLEKSISLTASVMHKLASTKLGSMMLHQYKQQFKGQLALARENKANVVISQAKSLLSLNRITSLEDIYQKIDRITSEEVLRMAGIYLNTNSSTYSSLLYESSTNFQ